MEETETPTDTGSITEDNNNGTTDETATTAAAAAATTGKGRKYRELTNSARKALVLALAPLCQADGTFARGVFTKLAKEYGIHRTTVHRVWMQHGVRAGPSAVNLPESEFSNRDRRGRTPMHHNQELLERIQAIPESQRRSYRQLAAQLQMPVSTAYRLMTKRRSCRKDGDPESSSSSKPGLTKEDRAMRRVWCHDHVDPITHLYTEMLDVIHIEEKWFDMAELNNSNNDNNDTMEDDDETDASPQQQKTKQPRIMFVIATARPRWDPDSQTMWDGRIGIWECADYVSAKMTSYRRPAGALDPKPFHMDYKRYRYFINHQLLPAVKEKCPLSMRSKQMVIQQGNQLHQRSLLTVSFPETLAKCQELEIDVAIKEHPAGSPELNVVNLGIWDALQTRLHHNSPTTLLELIEQAKQTYDQLSMDVLDEVWYTLQTVMSDIINCGGGNYFEITHSSRAMLESQGLLPRSIKPPARKDDKI